ncbi:MAG: dTMP kinase [Candidatus Omnitrophica bacterium]|nr:dTMP kinase [Candidatus Omnitrophota bacterium]
MGRLKKAVFITFEGTEGGGKSTQIRKAAALLRRQGRRVLLLREPGGTRVSEAVRAVLLDPKNKGMRPEAELLLYLAARAQLVFEKITPALSRGVSVILDRFEDSTRAYQGFGRGLSLSAIETVSRNWVRGDLKPDLTILLDIDPARGMARGGRHDRMEKESLRFHRRVRQGFLKMARRNPERYEVIDAALPIEEVARLVKGRLERVLR